MANKMLIVEIKVPDVDVAQLYGWFATRSEAQAFIERCKTPDGDGDIGPDNAWAKAKFRTVPANPTKHTAETVNH
ncbi:hypothetical protein SAMN05892883_2057 [Jatrophihabitans sp. GAS493]|uniref:hypothetical protein n=1 Tax=Jatrophihabitans sp. GAS493 TaxID=1907575 RepID=UPI000BB86B0D|nr:hypothetical protein [Jatrophihabitans sp. GAS493]SOD72706.1 hypothetical protein SAMN05892883_2057 [Jatrophihabitans sp. GAS493]